jgi:hypothetical protein
MTGDRHQLEEEPVNVISLDLARQVAVDRRQRLNRSSLRRSSPRSRADRTPPARPTGRLAPDIA